MYNHSTNPSLFVALGPELRIPLGRTMSVQLSTEAAAVGNGKRATIDAPDPGLAVGAWLGLVAAL